MTRQVTARLWTQGYMGPLLSWYYCSWIAPPSLDGQTGSGIPWAYILSATCLVVYTLVLTFRYVLRNVSTDLL